MEGLSYSDRSFEDTLGKEAAIIQDARQKLDRGELIGRRYAPLPEDENAAFDESVRREQTSIDKAKQDLGKRSSIYG